MEGGREARPGSDGGLNTQSGLNCNGRAPSPRGPCYRGVYGETTKHAAEASEQGEDPQRSDGAGGEVCRQIWPGCKFWAGGHAMRSDDGVILSTRRPVRTGVEHVT
jgi:hypothetical protein